MGCCNIYNDSFLNNLNNINNATIDINRLQALIPPYNPILSGLWFPIIYQQPQNAADFKLSNLLIRAKYKESFDPYDCKISSTGRREFPEEVYNNVINCDYCTSENTYSVGSWNLVGDGNAFKTYSADCNTINTAIDVRANYDDVIPKIPSLNNSYITGCFDLKYIKNYPATQKGFDNYNQSSMGFEGFIKYAANSSLKDFSQHPELRIDWKIGETLGEIPFNGNDTYHKDIDTHIKSYKRFLNTSKTCGNFILLKPSVTDDTNLKKFGLYSNSGTASKYKINKNSIPFFNDDLYASDILPSDDQFTVPYGFDIPNVNNTFIGKKKDLSHWMWNHTSGVVCWYRYSDVDRRPAQDNRPIPRVDLYISEGDVFWAKNSGDENSIASTSSCPVGTKVTDGRNIKYVIPYNSDFIYISKNIYSKFLKILARLEKIPEFVASLSKIDRINIAAIEATGPSYDEITTDVLLRYDTKPFSIDPDTGRPFEKQRILPGRVPTDIITKLDTLIGKFTNPINLYAQSDTISTPQFYWGNPNNTYGIPYGRNSIAIQEMLSKANDNISGFLGLTGFTHTPTVNRLNYVYDKLSLINTLNDKYGSYLWISKNTSARTTIKKSVSTHYYYDLDFEMVTDETIPLSNNSSISCGPASINDVIGYEQSFRGMGDNNYLNTALDTNKRSNKQCVSGVFRVINTANVANLKTRNDIVSMQPLFTGSGVSFSDIYYRDSYETAILIDGETLCSKGFICDSGLYYKYGLSNVQGAAFYTFVNNNITLNRTYKNIVYNPNLDIVGFSNIGGIYYESNLFGKDVFFNPNQGPVDNNPSFNFTTKKAGIKIYNIEIKKLRSNSDKGCKTFPLDKKCKCSSFVSLPGFPYSCGSTTIYTNGNLFTPNISTQSLTIIDKNGQTLPPVDKYYDPENPYGTNDCVRIDTITLPVHTRTIWDLITPAYDSTKGSMWVSINDRKHLSERNRIQANVAGITVYGNQWKKLPENNTSVQVELIDPLNKAIVGGSNILYLPLPCAISSTPYNDNGDDPNVDEEGNPIFGLPRLIDYRGRMPTVFLTFKYVPHKTLTYFKHPALTKMGVLQTCSYNAKHAPQLPTPPQIINPPLYTPPATSYTTLDQPGLKAGGDIQTSIVYDEKSYNWSIGDYSPFGNVPYAGKRVYGAITPEILKILELSKLSEHKKINLYIKNGNSWYKINSNTFGYKIDNDTYIGYPMFYEYLSGTKPSTMTGFLKSFILRNAGLYHVLNNNKSLYHNTFFNTIITRSNNKFFNYIDIHDLRAYFMVPPLLKYLEIKYPDDTLIKKYINYPISNNFDLDIYTKNLNDGLDTILLRESCFYEFKFIGSNITSYILEKIIAKDSAGKLYCSFRLPINANLRHPNIDGGVFDMDFWSGFNDDFKSFTISRNIDGWRDVFEFAKNFNSWDITNRYNDELPSSITYDNILYQLAKYNHVYLNYHKKLPSFAVNLYNSTSIIPAVNDFDRLASCTGIQAQFILSNNQNPSIRNKITSYLYGQEYSTYLKEEKDYRFPRLDMNYWSTSRAYPISNTKTISGIYFGDILYSGFKTIQPITDTGSLYVTGTQVLNPNYGSGYFWIDIPDSTTNIIRYEKLSYLDSDGGLYSKKFKNYDPHYIFNSTIKTNVVSFSDCSTTIYPNINIYTTNWKSPQPSEQKEYISKPYRVDAIYCNKDVPSCAGDTCNLRIGGSVNTTAKYFINTEADTLSLSSIGGEFAIGVGDGSYHNFPYVRRSNLSEQSVFNQIFPGKSADFSDISNNQLTLPTDDYFLYSNQKDILASKDLVLPIDGIANEMLFRLYNNTGLINREYIGRRSQSEFDQQQKIVDLKNMVEGSYPITTKDIYGLIPYDFNLSANRNNLKFNGNISVVGKISQGDTISVTIGTDVITSTVSSDASGVFLRVQGLGQSYRAPILSQKSVSYSYPSVLAGSNFTIGNSPGTTVRKIGQCSSYLQASIGFGGGFTSATWDGMSIGGEYKKCMVPVDWHYAEYGWVPCNHTHALGAYQEKVNKKYEVDGKAYQMLNTGPPCLPCGCICAQCVRRGVGPVGAPEGCSTLSQRSAQIQPGGRGVYNSDACLGCAEGCVGSPRGGTPRYDSQYAEATIDGLSGGVGPRQIIQIPGACSMSGCGPGCKPLDSSHTSLSEFWKFTVGGSLPPCECIDYIYGPCRRPSIACDSCSTRTYLSASYSYQYGNHTFALNAHKYRDLPLNPWVPVSGPAYNPGRVSGCDWSAFPTGDSKNSASESCIWFKCASTITQWDIYEVTTVTNPDTTLPDCPVGVLSISYDNNFIRINTFNSSFCFPISIRGSCPNLRVQVPNNNYTVSDSISSECSDCDVNDFKVKLRSSPAPQNWETVTETRTAILGYVGPIYGDMNQDMGGGCCVTEVDKACCGGNASDDAECRDTVTEGASYQCGKSAPDSFPWIYCLRCPVGPGPSLQQNWGGDDPISYLYGGAMINCIPFSFNGPSSNGAAAAAYVQEFETSMQYSYKTVAPCNNQTNIDINDLIEGVVPGSCSLSFTTLSIPYVAARRTLSESASSAGSAGWRVAYITYRYKRPKTIQDVLLAQPKCTTYYNSSTMNLGWLLGEKNFLEKYKNKGQCGNEIVCEDQTYNTCDDSNYCCKAGR